MRTDRVAAGDTTVDVYSVNTLVVGSGAAALNAAVTLHELGTASKRSSSAYACVISP